MKSKISLEKYLIERRRRKKALCMPLIDVSKFNKERLHYITNYLHRMDVDAILVGGSSHIDQLSLKNQIDVIKEITNIPVILFPGNITGISPNADGILFLSLLNSLDPYYIVGAQVLGAPIIHKYGLEVLPTAYLIIHSGTSVAFIGKAQPFPDDKPELVAMYALAAKYMGMRYLYLEAGSGARKSVNEDIIRVVRKVYDGMLIVGGGITSHQIARSKIRAGADAIVIGNLLELRGFEREFERIVKETI